MNEIEELIEWRHLTENWKQEVDEWLEKSVAPAIKYLKTDVAVHVKDIEEIKEDILKATSQKLRESVKQEQKEFREDIIKITKSVIHNRIDDMIEIAINKSLSKHVSQKEKQLNEQVNGTKTHTETLIDTINSIPKMLEPYEKLRQEVQEYSEIKEVALKLGLTENEVMARVLEQKHKDQKGKKPVSDTTALDEEIRRITNGMRATVKKGAVPEPDKEKSDDETDEDLEDMIELEPYEEPDKEKSDDETDEEE